MNIITYGTFDTFHYGHLDLLSRAKSLGEKLVVGVSTDQFNTIKGKTCYFNFEKRVSWINQLKCVDVVLPENSWEQKKEDIKKYKIDMLVMGDDWRDKFDYLPCDVYYLNRTDLISSTEIRNILKKEV